MHPLFPAPGTALIVAWHTVAIYVMLIIGFHLIGRRVMGQLTLVDLLVVILLGSAVETAMVAGDTHLYAGIISAGALFLLNHLLTLAVRKSKRISRWVAGGPVLLVHNGHFVEAHLQREGLTESDVLQAIRERGEEKVEDVRYAVMEGDGSITIVPMDHPAIRTEARLRREDPSS